jgi:phosphoserine aminotransferase
MLPTEVLERAQSEILDWNGSGMSVMEMSHRGKEYMSIAEKAEADLRKLMAIPDNYKVLFLQGGASSQFAMVPINLLNGRKSADYLLTGQWSKKAIAEGKRYCDVNVIADTSDTKFTTVPSADSLSFRMKPSSVLNSPIYRIPVMCHWWRICHRPSCRVRWM